MKAEAIKLTGAGTLEPGTVPIDEVGGPEFVQVTACDYMPSLVGTVLFVDHYGSAVPIGISDNELDLFIDLFNSSNSIQVQILPAGTHLVLVADAKEANHGS